MPTTQAGNLALLTLSIFYPKWMYDKCSVAKSTMEERTSRQVVSTEDAKAKAGRRPKRGDNRQRCGDRATSEDTGKLAELGLNEFLGLWVCFRCRKVKTMMIKARGEKRQKTGKYSKEKRDCGAASQGV